MIAVDHPSIPSLGLMFGVKHALNADPLERTNWSALVTSLGQSRIPVAV